MLKTVAKTARDGKSTADRDGNHSKTRRTIESEIRKYDRGEGKGGD